MTDTDISPGAVETLAQAFDVLEYPQTAITIRALSAALTQSRAETAAAYERAAEIAYEAAHNTNDISVIRDAILASIPQGDAPND